VRPPDQPPFRATFHDALTHGDVRHPQQGDLVHVLFDAKSRKVRLSDEYKGSLVKDADKEAADPTARWSGAGGSGLCH